MGTSTISQIEPVTLALIGLFSAAALVSVAVAAARHFLRKGEDASAPSGLAGRVSHVIGYIFAAALIASTGASIATLAKDAGGESDIQSAASRTGSATNPFAPTQSSGLEPIQGERSELGKKVEGALELLKEEAVESFGQAGGNGVSGGIKGKAVETEGAVSIRPIEDDDTARKLLSSSDYLRYKSGIKFNAVESPDGTSAIRAVS